MMGRMTLSLIEIDRVLKKHYRFTDQPSPERAGYGRAGKELNFIINYNITLHGPQRREGSR